MKMIDVNKGTTRAVALDASDREFVLINPYESHTVRNLNYMEDCEVLIIISEEYNQDDPDTFKYKKPITRCETHGLENCVACGATR